MRDPRFLLSFLVAAFFFPVLAHGQINVVTNPSSVSVAAGSQATFDIILVPTAGETFDAFTLAFTIGDGGAAVGNPQDDDNLLISAIEIGSLFDGTDFTNVVVAGGIGESAVLINFNKADVSNNILADGVVVTITVDSSTAAVGDMFFLNTNGLGRTAIFDDGSPLALAAGIRLLEIVQPTTLLGDANQDGLVNFFDIISFVSILGSNSFLAEADTNEDGMVDFLDIESFIGILASNRGT